MSTVPGKGDFGPGRKERKAALLTHTISDSIGVSGLLSLFFSYKIEYRFCLLVRDFFVCYKSNMSVLK